MSVITAGLASKLKNSCYQVSLETLTGVTQCKISNFIYYIWNYHGHPKATGYVENTRYIENPQKNLFGLVTFIPGNGYYLLYDSSLTPYT